MSLALKRTVAPDALAVSVAEAKTHLRVSHAADDTYIEGLIKAAVASCETYQGRSYVAQTWCRTLDCFPPGPIVLPRAPLSSVVSVTYTDAAGQSHTLDAGEYCVDAASEPGRILPTVNGYWPSDARGYSNDVAITYVAGYGDPEDVPDEYKHAVLFLVALWYRQREPVASSGVAEVPFTARYLLDPDRIRNV